jgi:fibronectin type 3 domain-containing protein
MVVVVTPVAPQGLAATPGNGQLILTWSPSVGATSYKLYQSTMASVSKTNGTLINNVSSPTIRTGLTNGTPSYYVVTAVNSAGESMDSNVASATPFAPIGHQPPRVVVTRPDLDQTGVFVDTAVVVRFTNPLDMATVVGANVSLSSSSGLVASTLSVSGNTLTLTPSAPLLPEKLYTLSITTGLHDSSNSALTTAFTSRFTTASTPPVLSPPVTGSNAVTLIWNKLSNASQYLVLRSTSAGGVPSAHYPTTGNTFTDTSAANGTTFYYRIIARTPFGDTALSNEVSAIPSPAKPTPPTGLTVVAGRSTALVSWYAISSATGYNLYRSTTSQGVFVPVATLWDSTTFLDTGLTPGTSVYYVVQTVAPAGPSSYSREVGGNLNASLAAAPGTFTAAQGYSYLNLSWSAVAGATGYVVLRVDSPTDQPDIYGYVTNGTTYASAGLTNGTTYRHFVGAITNGLVGDYAEVANTPNSQFAPQTVVPGLPHPDINAVTLNWSGGSGRTNTTVFRGTTAGGPYPTNVGSSAGSTLVDSTAVAGTQYFYVMRAERASAFAASSTEVTATPLNTSVPAAPTGLTLQASTGALEVHWAPVANAISYEVRSSTTPGGPYATVCFGDEPFETRCAFSATNEMAVYVVVRAYNGVAYGPLSAEATATPTALGAAAGLTTPGVGTTGGNGQLTVDWNVVNSATSYRVYRRTPTTDWAALGASTAATSINDTTVLNGVSYKYAVQAVNTSGPRVSVWAVTPYATPSSALPVRPLGFTVQAIDSGLLVSWQPVPGAINYIVRAGYSAGSAAGGSVTSCLTSEPYETRCHITGPNGTPFFVAMYVTTTAGVSAYTDEQMGIPAASYPGTTGVSVFAGNGSITLLGTLVSGAAYYRVFRHTQNTDWLQIATPAGPFLTEPITNGLPYRYAFQAVDGAGLEGGWTFVSSILGSAEEPLTPDPLVVAPGNGGVYLRWPTVLGIDLYGAERSPQLDGPFIGGTSNPDAFDNQLNLTGPNSVPVTAVLYSYSGGRYSSFTNQAAATPSVTAPLTPPASVVAGNEGMQVDWNFVSGATSYRVYRRGPNTDWQLAVTLSSAFWVDTNVQNGERYAYAVQAVGTSETSLWGKTVLATATATLPAQPHDFTVTPGNGEVQLEWSPVTNATSYNIYKATAQGGEYVYTVSANGLFESRLRVTAANGAQAWFYVRAVGPGGSGVASDEAFATPSTALPDNPVVSLSGPSAGTIHLSWSAVAGATGYKIHRRLSNGPDAYLNQTTSTTFDDTGLTTGTAYIYYVYAENAAGPGAWSNPVTFTAP